MFLKQYTSQYINVLKLLCLIFIIFLFFYINLYPTFWMDEAWDVSVAWSWLHLGKFGNPTYPVDGLEKVFFLHPPLPILLEIPLIRFFGISPFSIHFIPIILGLGTILILYLIAKKLFGEKVALLSSLFLAVNPLFFLMSRQLRPEIYVTFFSFLAFYLLLLGSDKQKLVYYFFTGIVGGFAFLSHYYSAFTLIAIGLYLLLQILKSPQKKEILSLALFLIGVLIVLLPFAVWILRNFSIFKLQFLGNVSNLTGFQKFLDTLLQEKYRYSKYPQSIPLILFTFIGLALFFKTLWQKAAVLIIFLLVFLLGLALLMPNKTLLYFIPIMPITSLAGGLILGSKSSIKSKKCINIILKLMALGFLGSSLIYTFSPKNLRDYFKGISYSELTNKFNNLIEKNYQDGTIVADPTYFLFLPDSLKENFISEHVIWIWRTRDNLDLEDIFRKNQITIFVYSPFWWEDYCKNQAPVCYELNRFLETKGGLLGTINRNASLIDYVYKINKSN